MSKKEDDLTIDGPGSPISLKKFREQNPSEKPLRVLIDGTGSGIAQDDDSLLYITPEECSTQAKNYNKNKFDGVHIPAYLYRYLSYMFLEHELLKSDQDLIKKFENENITVQSPDYIFIRNLIKYVDNNEEAQQVIGLIQLIGGALRIAKQENAQIGLFLDRPETALHPKRQARCMSMIQSLIEEYGDGLK